MDVLQVIKEQIAAAEESLRAYRPEAIDWVARANATAESLIPRLVQTAPAMKSYVQDVLNAPVQLRQMWTQIRANVNLPKEQIEAFDRQLSLDGVLRESVTGEVVSKVVTKFLMDGNPDLQCNGRSDYPDIYRGDIDYSQLLKFQRNRTKDDEFGAALKKQRPVRVLDGLEIKTCRRRVAVDCHHPHAGLHLVLLFSEISRLFTVDDLRVAFLRLADYRESERNTTATTVKYSFNGDRFVSLLGQP